MSFSCLITSKSHMTIYGEKKGKWTNDKSYPLREIPVAHRSKNTWNGGRGGGGGGGGGQGQGQHASTFLCQEWIFNGLFTVWKRQSLLLQLSGVTTKYYYCMETCHYKVINLTITLTSS